MRRWAWEYRLYCRSCPHNKTQSCNSPCITHTWASSNSIRPLNWNSSFLVAIQPIFRDILCAHTSYSLNTNMGWWVGFEERRSRKDRFCNMVSCLSSSDQCRLEHSQPRYLFCSNLCRFLNCYLLLRNL